MTDLATEIIIFGASGDLAQKKIFPSLWNLYKSKTISNIIIAGFSRRKLQIEEFSESIKKFCKLVSTDVELFNTFTSTLNFYSGDYQDHIFDSFNKYLFELVKNPNHNRIFYFALPPSVYGPIASLVKRHLCTCSGAIRVVLEKPFGYDLESARILNKSILELFSENDVYRIDHYLGKEMVQNILAVRFANFLISSIWNNQHISSVLISFKEDIGTFGRGNYYDNSGVIRDIMQNHMMQVVSLLAMEQPKSLDHNDVKDAKFAILQKIEPIKIENVVLGQYIGNKELDSKNSSYQGYLDDPLVPKDSITPTFANILLYINNERWKGVPFILKAGKALKERKAEIRIQFKSMPLQLFDKSCLNELVFCMQPDESIYLKLMLKIPGMGFDMHISELNLTYKERLKEYSIPDAYERLILDLITGSHIYFVRSDELEESWKLFTPLLHKIESEKIKPIPYVFGTRGPTEADDLNKKAGFVYNPEYKWTK